MVTSPIIKMPQQNGGTLYTFSSAARDLSRTFGDSGLNIVFSKFVLLNLPDIAPQNELSSYNYMQFNTQDGFLTTYKDSVPNDPNQGLTESIQNYLFNLESLLLSNSEYNINESRSVAERSFFKWLKELGVIRFRHANSQETTQGSKYVEEDESVNYSRVVKYVGDIEVTNAVNKAGESYTEVYINIPTEAGHTTDVLFDSIEDSNYKSNMTISNENGEYILGHEQHTHPQGLSLSPFYDYDHIINYTGQNANWMKPGVDESQIPTNSYFTDPVFNNVSNTRIIKPFNNYNAPASNDAVRFIRSSLDGISLDFNVENYTKGESLSTIQQLNSIAQATNFEFNAVLLYYDLIDSSTGASTTNLYGILFVDNVTPTGPGTGYIQRYPKYKPNSITKQNGNSYGFKVNLKFDTTQGQTGAFTIVNDYNTFSMGLFVDAIVQLQESSRIFQEQQKTIAELNKRLSNLEIGNTALGEISIIRNRLNELTTQFENSNLNMSSPTSMIDLIGKLSDNLQTIISGKTPLELQYNTDVITAGQGIALDTSTKNKIIVQNTVQAYNIVPVFNESTLEEISKETPVNVDDTKEVLMTLEPYTNNAIVYTYGNSDTLKIKIADSKTKWRKGQSVVIILKQIGTGNVLSLNIVTDPLNRTNRGAWLTECGSTNVTRNSKVEIICTDSNNLTFEVNAINLI